MAQIFICLAWLAVVLNNEMSVIPKLIITALILVSMILSTYGRR